MRQCLFHHRHALSVHGKLTRHALTVGTKHLDLCNLLFAYKLNLVKRVEARIKYRREGFLSDISGSDINVNVTGIVDGKMAAL